MLLDLILIYFTVVLGCFLSTVALILTGKSWNKLPFIYLQLIRKLQNLFPPNYPKDVAGEAWPSIIHRDEKDRLVKPTTSLPPRFEFTSDTAGPWAMAGDAIRSGVESIIQDDFSSAFDHAPSYAESLLRFRALDSWNIPQKVLFYVTLSFRIFFLFPVRLSLFIFSFVFVAVCALLTMVKDLSERERRWVSILYCRIFSASLGVVATYDKKENAPRRPGLVVANHITPNDVQIIWAGADHENSDGYIVTGQKHKGIIGSLEMLTSRICPSLWLERASAQERTDFLNGVLTLAKTSGPILLFPEGYCSNNSQVLQFRKAAFVEGIDIYPVAMKQDGRFSDAYWFEDQFYMYLLRLMMSWATVYDVTYLEKTCKYEDEDSTTFAARVQSSIAYEISKPVGQFDGGFWYKKSEQEKLKNSQQEKCASSMLKHLENVAPKESCRKSSTASSKSFLLVDLDLENIPTILAH
ncbi:unnamed protein product [Auanema sp. JU1783]|nr:unnamed protein product [Auanema sp. JU1783]